MGDSPEEIAAENARLRRELQEMQTRRERETADFEAKFATERNQGKNYADQIQQRNAELESMKTRMVRLTRQLDEEVTRRDQIQNESQDLERKLMEMTKGSHAPATASRAGRPKDRDRREEDEAAAREKGSQVSTKLMRVVDQWMRQRDLQQALLRGASINDTAFSTLVQALLDCPSLQTVDLSQNLLTMDSCSDVCQLITTAPNLSFVSLADNLLSLRSVGYFMTAVMERQNTKKLMPLDLLDLQGNEGMVAAAAAPVPDALLRRVGSALGDAKLPHMGKELVAQVMRALWRFLHDTAHPQVRDTKPDEVAFHVVDRITMRKMENALTKILLLGVDGADEDSTLRPVTANLAFLPSLDASGARPGSGGSPDGRSVTPQGRAGQGQDSSSRPGTGPAGRGGGSAGGTGAGGAGSTGEGSVLRQLTPSGTRRPVGGRDAAKPGRAQHADPFADLKTAFEPQREKQKTFNLKQIVTRNGTVLMNMLERLLETTEIDAYDMETDQTLLEFACQTGNMGLAKLCYRRGANLAAKTRKGDTAFNIVTRNKRYDMMEFLHTYGVKVNSTDSTGRSALHAAASGNDVDAICRLLEWGADVNIRDSKRRTPIHLAAAGGNTKATMLLLEVGADMNAKDEREYTAVAHAERNNHFLLMDRLVQLGGRGHGLQAKKEELSRAKSAKHIGDFVVSAGMLKSSSLGRIGKVAVGGLPGPMSPSTIK